MSLQGKVVAVTGATGNLGRAVVEALLRAGASCVTLDRSSAPSFGERAHGVGGLDLTDPIALGSALDEAGRRFGGLDGLVATAGGFRMGPGPDEADWAVWDAMLTANLRTAVAAAQAALPRLRATGGRLVLVGARPGLQAPAGLAAYAASKSAVHRLVESLAADTRERGVTVNAVLPSTLDTPQNRAAMPEADPSRWVPLDDVASVILFLLSDASRSVSGALVPVYGRS